MQSNLKKAGHGKNVSTLVAMSEEMPRGLERESFDLILYYWIKQRLISRKSGKEITLTPEEARTLETFLKSCFFVEVNYDLEQAMVADPAFRALAERLELGV